MSWYKNRASSKIEEKQGKFKLACITHQSPTDIQKKIRRREGNDINLIEQINSKPTSIGKTTRCCRYLKRGSNLSSLRTNYLDVLLCKISSLF